MPRRKSSESAGAVAPPTSGGIPSPATSERLPDGAGTEPTDGAPASGDSRERPAQLYHVPAGTSLRRCRKCEAVIAFVETASGKAMPVTAPPGVWIQNERLQWPTGEPDERLHNVNAFDGAPHWADCPAAKEFRKGDKA